MTAAEHDAIDLRTGGKWTPWQRAKNAVLRYAIRAALAVADRLPADRLLWLGRIAGSLAYAVLPGARRSARENLVRALSAMDAAPLARRAFRNAGENLARCLLLRRASFRACDTVDVPLDAWQIFRDALDEGRGVVFISAHLGPFELLPAAIAEHGVQPALVVRESYDPELDPVVDAHRLARGCDVIHRGRPGAAARIVRALRAGRPVGFLPDLGGRITSRPTMFLSRRVAFPVGPQRIAQRMRCPLLVGTLAFDPSRRQGMFSLSIERIDTSGPEEAITRRVADALTRSITRFAEHWLWMAPLRSLQTQDE